MAAKRKVNRDVIERRYLRLKLNRDRRRITTTAVRDYIGQLKGWLAASVKRTKKPGGLGR